MILSMAPAFSNVIPGTQLNYSIRSLRDNLISGAADAFAPRTSLPHNLHIPEACVDISITVVHTLPKTIGHTPETQQTTFPDKPVAKR
jgi:hypothetical protein